MDKRSKTFGEAIEYVVDKIRLGWTGLFVDTEFGRIGIEVTSHKGNINAKPFVDEWHCAPSDSKFVIKNMRASSTDYYANIHRFRSESLQEYEVVQALAYCMVTNLLGYTNKQASDIITYLWYLADKPYEGRPLQFSDEYIKEFRGLFTRHGKSSAGELVKAHLTSMSVAAEKEIKRIGAQTDKDIRTMSNTADFYEAVLLVIADVKLLYNPNFDISDEDMQNVRKSNNRVEAIRSIIR